MEPTSAEIHASRQRVLGWFRHTAPVIEWAAMDSPLGPLYVAQRAAGLSCVDFGHDEAAFLSRLDAQAHAVYTPDALAPVLAQLAEYFSGQRQVFDLPVDLSRMTDFQRQVLAAAVAIPAGRVLTYGQVAKNIGRPRASRAVGQALGSNPVPIVIPCHRVVGSNGQLAGYSGGGGVQDKRWLLQFEGALPR